MKLLPLSIFLLCFPILSYADNTKQETQNIKFKPYASLKLGYSNMGIKISKPTSKDFTNNTFSFNPAIGVEFNKKLLEVLSFRLEGEYFRNTSGDSKNWSVQRQWRTGNAPYITYHYETRKAAINTTIDGLLLNAYTDFDVITSIKPYIVVGFGYGKLSQENQLIVDTFNDSTVTGGDSSEYVTYSEKHSKYNMFWQLSLGVSYDVTDKISLNAEFRHIDYGSLKLYALEYKYIANQFLVGAKYLF
ncbi:MAG: porin family protein [Alphaproteobacteria bacterium]|nr:porin family protein [Alphaproteobacteria bacterium]